MAETHTCKVCRLTFDTGSDLVDHSLQHMDKVEVHACGVCGEMFFEKPDLQNHLSVHQTGQTFSCNDCGQTFFSEYLMKIHKEFRSCHFSSSCFGKLSCKVCSQEFTLKDLLKMHTIIHGSEDVDEYIQFPGKQGLDERLIFATSQQEDKSCETSDMDESFKINLKDSPSVQRRKNIQKEKESKLKCNVCDKAYCSKRSLAKHSLVHTLRKISADLNDSTSHEEPEALVVDSSVQDVQVSETINEELPACEKKPDSKPKAKQYKRKSIRCDLCRRYFKSKILYKYHKCKFNKTKKSAQQKTKTKNLKKIYGREKEKKTRVENYRKAKLKINLDAGDKPICPVCRKQFKNESSLKTHYQKFHGISNEHVCGVCEKAFLSRQNLAQHQARAHQIMPEKFSCGTCNESFNTKSSYDDHMLIHSGKTPHVCETCSKAFGSKRYLMMHVIRVHKNVRRFSCEECSETFASEFRFRNHTFFAHPTPFPCEICKKNFKTRTGLSVHEQMVHGEPFSCKLCSETLTSEKEYNKHLDTVHRDANPQECDTCDMRFPTTGDLFAHYREKEGDEKCNHTCKTCNKTFRTLLQLQNHEVRHTDNPTFTCSVCSKKFPDLVRLNIHSHVHSIKKAFLCEHCGKGFTRRTLLKSHLLTHKGQNPSVCKVCGYEAGAPSALEKHMITHTNERPFLCDSCGESFRSRQKLNSHKKLHLDEHCYGCKVCGRNFRNNAALLRHKLLHSDNSRPYSCDLCDKTCTQKDNLVTHYLSHSKGHSNVCAVCNMECGDRKRLRSHYISHVADGPITCKECLLSFNTRNELFSHYFVHRKPPISESNPAPIPALGTSETLPAANQPAAVSSGNPIGFDQVPVADLNPQNPAPNFVPFSTGQPAKGLAPKKRKKSQVDGGTSIISLDKPGQVIHGPAANPASKPNSAQRPVSEAGCSMVNSQNAMYQYLNEHNVAVNPGMEHWGQFHHPRIPNSTFSWGQEHFGPGWGWNNV